MDIPDTAIGSIFAAIVAGVLTFLGLVIAKEHKVSEFRQAWIDDTRTDVAELVSRLSLIISCYKEWDENERKVNASLLDAHFIAANQALMRTRLRLNPAESGSIEILEILEKTQTLFNSEEEEFEALEALEKPLIDLTQSLLKTEWNRVRKGEPIFIASKWIAGIFVFLAVGAIVFYQFSS